MKFGTYIEVPCHDCPTCAKHGSPRASDIVIADKQATRRRRLLAIGTELLAGVTIRSAAIPEIESGKERMHRRMRNLGYLFRLDARQFESRGNSLQRQADRIARHVRNDLMLRWGRTQAPESIGQTWR